MEILDKIEQDINNLGEKVNASAISEARCQARLEQRIDNADKRMDSHNDEIQKLFSEGHARQMQISRIDKTNGEQEQHIDNTDKIVAANTLAIANLVVSIDEVKVGQNDLKISFTRLTTIGLTVLGMLQLLVVFIDRMWPR